MAATIRTSLAVAILVLSALATSSAALGATVRGHVGQSAEGGTLCYRYHDRLIVRPPLMASSLIDQSKATTFVSGGLYGGGWHAQRVAYQAFLYRWNGSSWTWTGRSGPLYSGWTYDALQPVVWDNRDMGGTTVFSYPGGGYFAVYLRLTWYADALAPGGTREWLAGWYEYASGATDGYCTYL
jgi:hypothetical protein